MAPKALLSHPRWISSSARAQWEHRDRALRTALLPTGTQLGPWLCWGEQRAAGQFKHDSTCRHWSSASPVLPFLTDVKSLEPLLLITQRDPKTSRPMSVVTTGPGPTTLSLETSFVYFLINTLFLEAKFPPFASNRIANPQHIIKYMFHSSADADNGTDFSD